MDNIQQNAIESPLTIQGQVSDDRPSAGSGSDIQIKVKAHVQSRKEAIVRGISESSYATILERVGIISSASNSTLVESNSANEVLADDKLSALCSLREFWNGSNSLLHSFAQVGFSQASWDDGFRRLSTAPSAYALPQIQHIDAMVDVVPNFMPPRWSNAGLSGTALKFEFSVNAELDSFDGGFSRGTRRDKSEVHLHTYIQLRKAQFLYISRLFEGLCASLIPWTWNHEPQIPHRMPLLPAGDAWVAQHPYGAAFRFDPIINFNGGGAVDYTHFSCFGADAANAVEVPAFADLAACALGNRVGVAIIPYDLTSGLFGLMNNTPVPSQCIFVSEAKSFLDMCADLVAFWVGVRRRVAGPGNRFLFSVPNIEAGTVRRHFIDSGFPRWSHEHFVEFGPLVRHLLMHFPGLHLKCSMTVTAQDQEDIVNLHSSFRFNLIQGVAPAVVTTPVLTVQGGAFVPKCILSPFVSRIAYVMGLIGSPDATRVPLVDNTSLRIATALNGLRLGEWIDRSIQRTVGDMRNTDWFGPLQSIARQLVVYCVNGYFRTRRLCPVGSVFLDFNPDADVEDPGTFRISNRWAWGSRVLQGFPPSAWRFSDIMSIPELDFHTNSVPVLGNDYVKCRNALVRGLFGGLDLSGLSRIPGVVNADISFATLSNPAAGGRDFCEAPIEMMRYWFKDVEITGGGTLASIATGAGIFYVSAFEHIGTVLYSGAHVPLRF